MRKKWKPLGYLLIITTTLTVTACTKEGPAGTIGPAGPAGPAGQNGTNGTNGTNGNASLATMIFPQNVSLPFTAVNLSNSFSAITKQALDSGVVIGYVTQDAGGTWFPLPYSKKIGPSQQIDFRPAVSLGLYQVDIRRNDDIQVQQSQFGSGSIQIKVVVMTK